MMGETHRHNETLFVIVLLLLYLGNMIYNAERDKS